MLIKCFKASQVLCGSDERRKFKINLIPSSQLALKSFLFACSAIEGLWTSPPKSQSSHVHTSHQIDTKFIFFVNSQSFLKVCLLILAMWKSLFVVHFGINYGKFRFLLCSWRKSFSNFVFQFEKIWPKFLEAY